MPLTQPGGGHSAEEELAAVSVGSGVSHGQHARAGVLQLREWWRGVGCEPEQGAAEAAALSLWLVDSIVQQPPPGSSRQQTWCRRCSQRRCRCLLAGGVKGKGPGRCGLRPRILRLAVWHRSEEWRARRRAANGGSPCTRGEVAALAHELGNHAVEGGAFEVQRLAAASRALLACRIKAGWGGGSD